MMKRGTIGSYPALYIINCAREEGFRSVCIVKSNETIWRSFLVAIEIICVEASPSLGKVFFICKKLN